MSNPTSEVATAQATAVSVAEAATLAQTFAGVGSDLAGVQFLKFTKGEWLLGRELNTFPGNTLTAIPNLRDARRGYQCWKDGVLVDEVWNPLAVPLPDKGTLPNHGPYSKEGDGWQDCIKVQLVILPPEGGVPIRSVVTFNSAGGRNACGALFREYAEALKSGVAMGKYPVVLFGTSSYKHPTYGKVHVPTLKINGWMGAEEAATLVMSFGRMDTGAAHATDPVKAPPVAAAPKKPVAQGEVGDDEIPF